MTSSAKHRDAATEQPAFTLSANALSEAFKSDATAAGTQYINKAILIDGTITSVEENRIILNNVVCTMDSTQAPKLASLKAGDAVKIQGRLSTYNDLMEEIVLDQCVLK